MHGAPTNPPARHRAETTTTLRREDFRLGAGARIPEDAVRGADVIVVCLPVGEASVPSPCPDSAALGGSSAAGVFRLVRHVAGLLGPQGVLVVYDAACRLPYHDAYLEPILSYKFWFVARVAGSASRSTRDVAGASSNGEFSLLPPEHAGVVIYSREPGPLRHADLRIAYERCPACGGTTKDYGGKKHLYPAFGTLTSDVWRDIAVEPDDVFPEALIRRIGDLLSVAPRTRMVCLGVKRLLDAAALDLPSPDWCQAFHVSEAMEASDHGPKGAASRGTCGSCESRRFDGGVLHRADALEVLRSLDENSVDFAFADPPYNLAKGYSRYADSLENRAYCDWCDRWISLLERALRPGGVLALLNLPLWAIRHFRHLNRTMRFRNWVVWDALSQPVRRIMPAHYAILLFSKIGGDGAHDRFVELAAVDRAEDVPSWLGSYDDLTAPMAEGFCRRAACVKRRTLERPDPRRTLSDLWTDIHRLKHNSRRRDHPCQLPPPLAARLIALHSRPGDSVLDPFNGIGTTTLCAQALGRRFTGIELDPGYHALAVERHGALGRGANPFAKGAGGLIPAVKNNTTPRIGGRPYEVTKRALQLEIVRLAKELGRTPSRDEVEASGRFPIRYYDEYFRTWSEAVAAVRAARITERANRGAGF